AGGTDTRGPPRSRRGRARRSSRRAARSSRSAPASRAARPTSPRSARASRALEPDRLRALPERLDAELAQPLAALRDGQEVVAGELAGLRREAAVAVREQELGLRDAARVPEQLAGRRIARGVLERHAEVEVAERDPARLAGPADVDHALLVRQQALERLAGARRALVLEPAREREGAARDPDLTHGRAPRSRRARSITSSAMATSSSSTFSAGLWEMPPSQRRNSIATGQMRASAAASCPAPLAR